jgi:hypothetical protein
VQRRRSPVAASLLASTLQQQRFVASVVEFVDPANALRVCHLAEPTARTHARMRPSGMVRVIRPAAVTTVGWPVLGLLMSVLPWMFVSAREVEGGSLEILHVYLAHGGRDAAVWRPGAGTGRLGAAGRGRRRHVAPVRDRVDLVRGDYPP